MKNFGVLFVLICLFSLIALINLSCCSNDNDSDDDDDIWDSPESDDDTDDDVNEDDDTPDSDDDDDDDDDNDDDNDDTNISDPDLFVLAGEPGDMSGYFRVASGWEEHEVPYCYNKKGMPSMYYNATMPLGVKNGENIYAAFNSYEIADLFFIDHYHYCLHEIGSEEERDWSMTGGGNNSLIQSLQYISEDQWYTVELNLLWAGNKVVYHKNNFSWVLYNSMASSDFIFIASSYFVDKGEGMIAGLNLDTAGGILKFSGGTHQIIAMPGGHEEDVLSALWLADINHGWAIASTKYSPYPYFGLFPCSAPGTLFYYDSGTWTEQEPPAGCEGTQAARFLFYDENFGLVATRQDKYWLFQDGQWSCEDLPFSSAEIPIIHIVSPENYFIGDHSMHFTSIYNYRQGQMNEIAIPESIGSLYGIAWVREDSPLWMPFQIDYQYPQPLPFL